MSEKFRNIGSGWWINFPSRPVHLGAYLLVTVVQSHRLLLHESPALILPLRVLWWNPVQEAIASTDDAGTNAFEPSQEPACSGTHAFTWGIG